MWCQTLWTLAFEVGKPNFTVKAINISGIMNVMVDPHSWNTRKMKWSKQPEKNKLYAWISSILFPWSFFLFATTCTTFAFSLEIYRISIQFFRLLPSLCTTALNWTESIRKSRKRRDNMLVQIIYAGIFKIWRTDFTWTYVNRKLGVSNMSPQTSTSDFCSNHVNSDRCNVD